jgi:two-component system, NarL family, sensor histidine kinase DevS
VNGPQAATEVAIAAAEQERSRWARELHDETLQALAVLRMRLASALRDASAETLRRAAQTAVEQIDEEIVKLRRLITELRPASLDAIGLEAALHELAEKHKEASGIEVACSFDLPEEGVAESPPALETAVYRLVQEGLNNVSKHSSASKAELTVALAGEAIAIEVADDGAGFDPAGVQEGFGLVGMRERAALLGGTLEVDSAKGSGTRLRARLPLAEAGS